MLISQPITAAREVAPRDGLAGAVGLGVIVPPSDPLDPSGKWPLGYHLEGPDCSSPEVVSADVCAEFPTPSSDQPTVADMPRWMIGPDSAPFLVRAGLVCSAFGSAGDDLGVWQAEAARILELCQWSQIAHELWEGTQAQADTADNRYLTDGTATVVGSGVSVVKAVALLEESVGSCSCGDTTVIHVPRRAVAYLAEKGQISSVTGQTARMFTHNGSLVVADRGYTGTGPADDAVTATSFWMFATSVLSARLDSVEYPQRTLADSYLAHENKRLVRAERRAAISWLCCHYAAEVTVA